MKTGHDNGFFSYSPIPIPVSCYFILLARLQGEQSGTNARFAETREALNQEVQKSPEDAKLLSSLAVVDALLGKKQDAVGEARHAVEMRPTFRDALAGPGIAANLALVARSDVYSAIDRSLSHRLCMDKSVHLRFQCKDAIDRIP